ncbi:hypothetical protein Trydic_g6915 [Trypoxylus dichotomus]
MCVRSSTAAGALSAVYASAATRINRLTLYSITNHKQKSSGIAGKGLNRRVAPPITLPVTLEDPATTWKGPPPGSEPQNFTPNSANSFPTAAGFQGPSPFQGPPAGAGSPAGAPSYQGPPPGSSTPQYTASPAPSGSSTPGPPGPPQPNAGFPPPPNSAGPPYNGPGPGPFGSPSAGGPPFGRPGSSGPPFVGGPGGNPHFVSPGQAFGAPGFGMPPGSPFGPGPGHPMPGPMGPGHGMMHAQMGGPNPVDRMDQGRAKIMRTEKTTHNPRSERTDADEESELNAGSEERGTHTIEFGRCCCCRFATCVRQKRERIPPPVVLLRRRSKSVVEALRKRPRSRPEKGEKELFPAATSKSTNVLEENTTDQKSYNALNDIFNLRF